MDTQAIIDLEHEYVLGVYGRAPFVLERGQGATLYDTAGRAYIDCVAGIAVNALGYGDAGIQQAMAEGMQSGVLHVSNLYHTAPHARLAQLLCESQLCRQGAFLQQRRRGQRRRLQVCPALRAGPWRRRESQHPGLHQRLSWPPHGQPCRHTAAQVPGSVQATHAGRALRRVQRPGQRPSQMDATRLCDHRGAGAGGGRRSMPATPAFLAGLRALADEYDALLIYDEIQCGVGRTGHFWAHQGYCTKETTGCTCANGCQFEPDILTAAKPLAGGLPIGAILVRQKVADVMQKGDHGSTFAGGPFVTHVAAHVVQRVAEPAFLAECPGQGPAPARAAGGDQQPPRGGGAWRGADGGRGIGHRRQRP